MTKRQEQEDLKTSGYKSGTADVKTCPNCQRPKDEWSDVEGFESDNILYCCEGCAQNIGCTCGDEEDEEEERAELSDASAEDTTVFNRDADI